MEAVLIYICGPRAGGSLFEDTKPENLIERASAGAAELVEAKVAELVDAHDSKSCSFGSVGSIPTFGT